MSQRLKLGNKQTDDSKKVSNPLAPLKSPFFLGDQAEIELNLFQILDIRHFSLGESIFHYHTTDNGTHDMVPSYFKSHTDLYFVYTGRVRILCCSAFRVRENSALVLEAGQSFGADGLLCQSSLSYRAIAASACQIARIPISQALNLLERSPQGRLDLLKQVQQRQRLIFFKGLTQLQTLSSKQIQQYILPNLTEQAIEAGSLIAKTILSPSGYCWLRSGQLYSPTDPGFHPKQGAGWSGADLATTDWLAESELQFYQLPFNPWQQRLLEQAGVA